MSYIALGGLVAAILGAGVALGQADKPPTAPPDTQAAAEQPKPAETHREVFPPKTQEQDTAQQKSLCEKAGPETDLCQQWRMAEAAEKQVKWIRRQYHATLGEIGALVLTLLATATAAWAAVVAARAARDSVKVTATAELPIVVASPIRIHNTMWGTGDSANNPPHSGSRIEVVFLNYGRTPAILETLCVEWRVCPSLPEKPVYSLIIPLESGHILNANSPDGPGWVSHDNKNRITYDADAFKALRDKQTNIWVYGFLTYRDFLRNPHKIGFCARWEKGTTDMTTDLVDGGPDTYKYQTKQ